MAFCADACFEAIELHAILISTRETSPPEITFAVRQQIKSIKSNLNNNVDRPHPEQYTTCYVTNSKRITDVHDSTTIKIAT